MSASTENTGAQLLNMRIVDNNNDTCNFETPFGSWTYETSEVAAVRSSFEHAWDQSPTGCLLIFERGEFESLVDGFDLLLQGFFQGEFKLAGMYIVDSDTNAVLLGPLEQFLAYKVTYQTSMAIAKGYPILTRNGDASHPLSGPLTLYFAYHPQSSHGTDLNLAASDKGDDKIKVPRPANAFILYRKDRHNKVVEENPGMHNTIISILIGNLWAHEHSKVKDMYHAKATQMKEEHAQKHPEYKYKPRKSSEKKRRMTKKKAAAIAADVIANPSPALINVARSLVSQHKPAPLRSTAPQHMKAFTDDRSGGALVHYEQSVDYIQSEDADFEALFHPDSPARDTFSKDVNTQFSSQW